MHEPNHQPGRKKNKKKNTHAIRFILENILLSKPAKKQQDARIFCPSQDTCDSLATPLAHSSPAVHVPLPRQLCFGTFSGQGNLVFCLVRPRSPKGKRVLSKQLIKWLRRRMEPKRRRRRPSWSLFQSRSRHGCVAPPLIISVSINVTDT